MTYQHIRDVVQKYDNILYPVTATVKDGTELQHVRWMCNEIPEMMKTEEVGKIYRWLGFIQGVLWVHGIYTIEQLCEHNKR